MKIHSTEKIKVNPSSELEISWVHGISHSASCVDFQHLKNHEFVLNYWHLASRVTFHALSIHAINHVFRLSYVSPILCMRTLVFFFPFYKRKYFSVCVVQPYQITLTQILFKHILCHILLQRLLYTTFCSYMSVYQFCVLSSNTYLKLLILWKFIAEWNPKWIICLKSLNHNKTCFMLFPANRTKSRA